MANQLGKRLECPSCGSEVMCIKPGDGIIHCCDKEMTIKQPMALPTAD
jgi:hypothetical protein